MTTSLLANLLADCLRHPDDPVRRLVLADAYLDAAKVKHAGMVRATAGWKWRRYTLSHLESCANPDWPATWYLGPAIGAVTLWVRYRPDLIAARERWCVATHRNCPLRQTWSWEIVRQPHRQGDSGMSPNRGNAMWRALKALLQHRRRHCICEGWKNEE